MQTCTLCYIAGFLFAHKIFINSTLEKSFPSNVCVAWLLVMICVKFCRLFTRGDHVKNRATHKICILILWVKSMFGNHKSSRLLSTWMEFCATFIDCSILLSRFLFYCHGIGVPVLTKLAYIFCCSVAMQYENSSTLCMHMSLLVIKYYLLQLE